MEKKTATYPDLDRGWSWMVMFASFGSLYIIGGMNFSVGLVHATLLERYNEGQAVTSWVGALHTAIMNLAAPLSSFIINKYSVRTAVVSGGVLFTIGYIATAFAPTLGVTVFTCGIISGLGGAVGWTASIIVPGFYFRRYRNLAIGFAMTGNAVGLFGTAPAIQTARDVYGPSGFFIILACISVHQIIFGMLMKPSTLELQSKQNRDHDTSVKSKTVSMILSGYFKVCTNLQVATLSFSFLFICISLYAVLLHLPNFCIHTGKSPMHASYILSVLGISSIFGRIVTGFAANLESVNEIYLHSGSQAAIGIAALLFPVYGETYVGQLVFGGIVGLFFGTPFVTATPINIKLVGLSNMAAALSIELFMGGMGGVIGPVLTSFLLDRGLTYSMVFILTGIFSLLSAGLALVTIVISRMSSCSGNTDRVYGEEDIEIKEIEKESMLEKSGCENDTL